MFDIGEMKYTKVQPGIRDRKSEDSCILSWVGHRQILTPIFESSTHKNRHLCHEYHYLHIITPSSWFWYPAGKPPIFGDEKRNHGLDAKPWGQELPHHHPPPHPHNYSPPPHHHHNCCQPLLSKAAPSFSPTGDRTSDCHSLPGSQTNFHH